MATKQDIINLIDSNLKTGGNASGPAINALLKNMLDFTENKEIGFFSFQSKKPVTDATEAALLNYSFRGIANRTVNFTFDLRITSKVNTANQERLLFLFKIEPALYNTLKLIHRANEPIYFTVPTILSNELFTSNIISLDLMDKEGTSLAIEILNARNIKPNSKIFTSITFHSPDFKK